MTFIKALRSRDRWRIVAVYAALGPPVGLLATIVLYVVIGLALHAGTFPSASEFDYPAAVAWLPIGLFLGYVFGLLPTCVSGVIYSYFLEPWRPRLVGLFANALAGGLVCAAFPLVFILDRPAPEISELLQIAAALGAIGAIAATACAVACQRLPPTPPEVAASPVQPTS